MINDIASAWLVAVGLALTGCGAQPADSTVTPLLLDIAAVHPQRAHVVRILFLPGDLIGRSQADSTRR